MQKTVQKTIENIITQKNISSAKITIPPDEFSKDRFSKYAIVSDIGGTTTPIAVFGKDQTGKINPIFKITFESAELQDFDQAVSTTLEIASQYGLSAQDLTAAFGVAGPIQNKRTYSKPTNLEWDVSQEKIMGKTGLKTCVLLNDFEIIGYGIDMLDKNDIVQLNEAERQGGTAAIVGAGTGLGMAILPYDARKGLHTPTASEGGHAAFPVNDMADFKIAQYINAKKGFKQMPGYEPFVSGPGLVSLYEFFAEKHGKNALVESAKDKAAMIAQFAKEDSACRQAMDKFVRYYARAASNLALTAMSTDGVYIAGGIAPKIIDELKTGAFMEEFESNYRQSELLKKMPVYVVMNPEVGLMGAANAAMNFYDDLKHE